MYLEKNENIPKRYQGKSNFNSIVYYIHRKLIVYKLTNQKLYVNLINTYTEDQMKLVSLLRATIN